MRFSVAEARNRFCELLKRAQNGEAIVVTRHGKAVGRLRGFKADIAPADLACQCIASTDALIAGIVKSARRRQQQ